jgi:GlpG protein
LFGFGWIAKVRYAEFARILSQRTIAMFVIWAVACVYFTYTHVMNIGNVAHISGLFFGAAVAGLMVKPAQRLWYSIGLVVLVCGSVGALFWNPRSLYWVAKAAQAAENRRDYARAAALYRSSLDLDANPDWSWYNLAEVYAKQRDWADFDEAVSQLKATDPEGAEFLLQRYKDDRAKPN